MERDTTRVNMETLAWVRNIFKIIAAKRRISMKQLLTEIAEDLERKEV